MKNQNQKGSTLIGIIAVIIVAIICGGGFLAWKYYSELEEKEGAETLEIETLKDETADLSAEVLTEEDWETYRNEEYGFEMKYPNNWYIVNDNCANKDYIFISVGISDEQVLNQYECSYLAIDVVNENWIIGTRDFKDIKIGEIDGKMDSLTCLGGCLILDKNHSNFVIRVSKNPLEDEITKKILSTFKFLD